MLFRSRVSMIAVPANIANARASDVLTASNAVRSVYAIRVLSQVANQLIDQNTDQLTDQLADQLADLDMIPSSEIIFRIVN